jgi:hypothetical protein
MAHPCGGCRTPPPVTTSAASHPSSPAPATRTWHRTAACTRTCVGPLRSPQPPTASVPPSSPDRADILDRGPRRRSLEPPTSSPPGRLTSATCSSPRCLPRRSPVLLPQKLVQPPPSSVAASITAPSPAAPPPLAEGSHVTRGHLVLAVEDALRSDRGSPASTATRGPSSSPMRSSRCADGQASDGRRRRPRFGPWCRISRRPLLPFPFLLLAFSSTLAQGAHGGPPGTGTRAVESRQL